MKQYDSSGKLAPEFVDLLWKLKRTCDAKTDLAVQLSRLFDDPSYREDVLRQAEASPSDELRALVRVVRASRAEASSAAGPTPAEVRGSTIASELRAAEVAVSRLQKDLDAARRGSVQPPTIVTKNHVTAIIIAGILLAGGAGSLVIGSRDSGTPEQLRPAQVPVADPSAPSHPMPVIVEPPASATVAFRVHGSNTIGEKLAPNLVRAFLEKRGATGFRIEKGSSVVEKTLVGLLPSESVPTAIEIHAHGSSTAFTDLAAGRADIGQSSRPIKAEEVQSLLPSHGDLSQAGEHVLGLDGLAIIVHPANPVPSLTTPQVAAVFAGEIRDWSELGGHPGPVSVYARDENSGTWDTFLNLVLKPHGKELVADAARFESSTELSDRVAGDPNGIGFIGLPYVRQARALPIADEPGLQAFLPTPFTVATEDYPLSRRLYLYAAVPHPNPLVSELIEFALSDEGQEIVANTGFVSQRLVAELPRFTPEVPESVRTALADTRRLSLAFRFRTGSDDLDSKARQDLDRLTRFLARNPARRLVLAGFADAKGSARVNETLSRRRADVVARELAARGVQATEIHGFGPAMPVASNTVEAGRSRNRRVEVWIDMSDSPTGSG